jgi:Zn-dependent protease with chaperone function
MNPTRRALGLGAAAAAAFAASPTGVLALGGDSYAVTGKKGPFVKQVANRAFNAGVGQGGGGAMGLASDALNLGRYQAARIRMPQTEAKIAALLASIDAQWPYAKGQPLQVHILGVDYYNAYSLPDGSIVVAFGLLENATSDDEIAFVLAHELGHVRLGHFAKQPSGDNRAKMLAGTLAQVYTISQALPSNAGSSALAAATQAGATNDLIHFLSNVMVEPEHTRAQEDEADCIGYDLSQSASYSADSASARVFDTIQADQQRHTESINNLDSQLKTQLSQAITPSATQAFLSGNTTDMRNSLLIGAGRLAIGAMAAHNATPPPQHRPPEERKKGMAQYSAEAYPAGAPLRDEQHSWLESVRATKEYAEGRAAVDAVAQAKHARADGRYPDAKAALQRARLTSFRNAPLVLNEAARLADDMGETALSEKLFVQANASPDQTVDGYIDHVRMLLRTRQNDRAFAVIREGVSRFGNDEKPFISLEIAVARQAGRDDEVDDALNRCSSYNNPALTKDCELAAGRSAQSNTAAQSPPPPPKLPNLPFNLPHFP